MTVRMAFYVALFLGSALAMAKVDHNIPAVAYMDQVVQRKKAQIQKTCPLPKRPKFMVVELEISPSGEAKARLLGTDIKSSGGFLNCALSMLNRMRFKPFSTQKVSRIYRFFTHKGT